jgi:hypothetical protein
MINRLGYSFHKVARWWRALRIIRREKPDDYTGETQFRTCIYIPTIPWRWILGPVPNLGHLGQSCILYQHVIALFSRHVGIYDCNLDAA